MRSHLSVETQTLDVLVDGDTQEVVVTLHHATHPPEAILEDFQYVSEQIQEWLQDG